MDRGQRLLVNPRLALPLRLADVARGAHRARLPRHALQHARAVVRDAPPRHRAGRPAHAPAPRARAAVRRRPRHAPARAAPRLDGHHGRSQDDNPLLVPRGSVLQERIRQLELDNVTARPVGPHRRGERRHARRSATGSTCHAARREGILEPPRLFADVDAVGLLGLRGLRRCAALFVDGELFPTRRWRTRFNTGWDFDQSEISEALFEFGYADERGNDLGVGVPEGARTCPLFFEDFSIEDERFDDAEDGLRRDQPGLAVRALRVHAQLGGQLPAAATRSRTRSRSPTRPGSSTSRRCGCWAVAPRVRAGPPGRLSRPASATAWSASATTPPSPSARRFARRLACSRSG